MRTHLALWLAALSMVTLVGCASTDVGEPPLASDSLFADAAFKPPSAPVQPARALDISPEMVRFAEQQVRPSMRSKGLRDGLIDALYTKGQLRLDYDGADTRTASEAFAARRGNCLSLVLMTAAFARHFEMPVAFNSLVLDEWWTRDRGLFIVAGHVNITLARPVAPMGHMVWGDDTLFTIDFLPPQMLVRQRSRTVSEATVLAMYANNRAAELLAAGQLDDAYWWARAAVQSDPRWLAAHNTLAVIYHRKGLDGRAEDALRAVLAREPLNVQALSNIVVVLGAQFRPADARRYAEQLAQIQPVPPYQYFDEGIVAMKAGDFATARALFRREIARAAYVPEFHFWLALASYGLGDWEAARAEMARAMENSTTVKDHELYGAKLAWLNQQRRR